MKKILSNVFLVFAALIFICAIVFVTISGGSENIYVFGYKPFIIATGSMETEYMTHSLVLIKQGGYDDVRVGDVIAFESDALNKRLAFHRVVEQTNAGFITKGDNNPSNDGLLVTHDNFIGREVFHTNWTAHYMKELSKPYGVIRVIVLPVVALIFLCVGMTLFYHWKADRWLKRLIISTILLFTCSIAFISYMIWDSQRIIYVNDHLKNASNEFLAHTKTDGDFVAINNRKILGVIKIPAIDIEYPIIEYENNASLDISIAKYAGPLLNEIGNVVLAGHRSANGGNLFFTNINQLQLGDIAAIIDPSGRSIDYRMVSINTHMPDDMSILESGQSDRRELTLISCTVNLKDRYAVRFIAIDVNE